MKKAEKHRVQDYFGVEKTDSWQVIRKVEESVASLAILPIQDVLSLGTAARMNKPGTTKGNWIWRMEADQLDSQLSDKLSSITKLFGRS